jgi:hypothetical protein
MDADYFDRFTDLVITWKDHEENDVRELAQKLAEAGKQNNADIIRENLPALCEKLRELTNGKAAEAKPVGEILSRIKDALLAGETEKAETILNELNTLASNHPVRHLYLRLYEFLLTGETEKAISMIEEH